jgi:hypothetical protein
MCGMLTIIDGIQLAKFVLLINRTYDTLYVP